MGPGGMGPGQTQTYTASELRVVLVSDTGKARELAVPISGARLDSEGFAQVHLPFAAFKGEKDGSFALKRLMIFGDAPDTLYIGEISTITDDSKITGNMGGDQSVARGDTVEFTATADGGAATLEYSWDFDDKNGIQEDATGPNATHVYREPGDYVATLTISDVHGVKQPLVLKAKIHVEE